MAQSKSPQRRRAPPKPPPPPAYAAVWSELLEGPGRKIIALVAVLTAIAYLGGFLKPAIDSRLPSASQDDVKAVADKHLADEKKVIDQLDKLDMRQSQSASRGQNVANQLRTLRMQALRAELDRLKDAKDDASRTLHARDQQELDALIQEQNSAPMP